MFQNEKVKERQTTTPISRTEVLGVVTNVPSGSWNANTQYQKLNIVRSNNASYMAKKDNIGVEPTITQGWEEVWQVVAYDGGNVSPDGNYPSMSVGQATNDSEGNNIADQFNSIREDIQNESHFRGYLATNAEIKALQGTPNDYAYSAESGTVWIYQTETGWTDSRKPVPDQTTPKSTTLPLMDGTASAGTSNAYAAGDHRHPSDTNKVDKNQIVQETGQSESNIMSQKAVTTQLEELEIKTERLPLKDTRHSGELSTWYMKNAPKSMIGEFKDNSDIGLNSITNAPFACLFTMTPWWDKSGGTSSQLAFTNEPNKFYYRTADGLGNNWYPWQTFASMPIGSVLMFADDTHPASIYGGTWEKLTNRVLIGAGDKYSLGAVGGSEDSVVVDHGLHLFNFDWMDHGNLKGKYLGSDKFNDWGTGGRGWNEQYSGECYPAGQNVGEYGKGKNMMPFLAVNIWKKIA